MSLCVSPCVSVANVVTSTPLQAGRTEMGKASLHYVNADIAREMSLGLYLSDLAVCAPTIPTRKAVTTSPESTRKKGGRQLSLSTHELHLQPGEDYPILVCNPSGGIVAENRTAANSPFPRVSVTGRP